MLENFTKKSMLCEKTIQKNESYHKMHDDGTGTPLYQIDIRGLFS
jgi:hypothetical protein